MEVGISQIGRNFAGANCPNTYEAIIAEMNAKADTIRNSIKAEGNAGKVEELIICLYFVCWTSILSNRFDSTTSEKGPARPLQSSYHAGQRSAAISV